MKAFVEAVAKALVDNPEEVEVHESVGNSTVIIKVKVAQSDIGKIIGKQGANANSIRTILEAAGGKQNKRYILEIIE